jgi:hypothetical protein
MLHHCLYALSPLHCTTLLVYVLHHLGRSLLTHAHHMAPLLTYLPACLPAYLPACCARVTAWELGLTSHVHLHTRLAPCYGSVQTHARLAEASSRSGLNGKAGMCYFCGARFRILRRRYDCCHVGCVRSFCDSCGIVIDRATAVCNHHAREYLTKRSMLVKRQHQQQHEQNVHGLFRTLSGKQ